MRRRGRVVGVVVALVLAAGCTGGQGEPSEPATPVAFDGEVVTAGDGGGVAELTVPASGAYAGRTRIAVQAIVVDGPVMELRVAFTPLGGAGASPDGRVALGDMLERHPLIGDVTSLVQHEVIEGWHTDLQRAVTPSGVPVLYQGWFAAPETRVEALDVVMGPEGPTFRDVPVTYR
ncbi:hypothetical protein [Cellulomonas wangsupingiae]|uniref:Lipoprotein n=1 Tax=Cellulomonas wangsupingiae TaxID=2968085 RepID=A0ABY5K906_9CELL|nr:hypothetical protein [Cellulomonas wangsupingiae]MCC2334804.1 hypothetical protein [Cellulomonas wangsupingiae]MCM0638479.1 hypothetical protein [Cellulomonas wangsupingiae]UUI66243.1 hypothetical protein NP075_05875 [Cellulomonas wangsupingiae]